MNVDPIPQTDSIEELANFWQTHDMTDYEDEFEAVAEPVFRRDSVVRLRLPSGEADVVKRLAASRGVDPADLIREWVAEKVQAAS